MDAAGRGPVNWSNVGEAFAYNPADDYNNGLLTAV